MIKENIFCLFISFPLYLEKLRGVEHANFANPKETMGVNGTWCAEINMQSVHDCVLVPWQEII